MSRIIHQPNRSYRSLTFRGYRSGPWGEEVMAHVRGAVRPDADPIFNEIAHQAAINGINHGYVGREGVCFLQPTDHPRGYFSLLKFIAANPYCIRKDIMRVWNANPSMTLDRLIYGKLIAVGETTNPNTKRKCQCFVLSQLGKAYLASAKKYVIHRYEFTGRKPAPRHY